MYKKLAVVALTGALTLGTFSSIPSNVNLPFAETKVEAAMPQGYSLHVQTVDGRDVGADIAAAAWVQDRTQAGTVVFKVKPSNTSNWDGKSTLTLRTNTTTNTTLLNVKKAEYLEENGEKFVLAYIYINDPKGARNVYLYTNETGEHGRSPFEYEAVFIAGKDLTKTTTAPIQPKKVYWEGAELKKGQIGKVNVLKPINLWKRDANNKLSFVRILKPGESYRVYSYDSLHGGQYGLGAGLYITNMKGYIQYKTPSKAKLAELNN